MNGWFLVIYRQLSLFSFRLDQFFKFTEMFAFSLSHDFGLELLLIQLNLHIIDLIQMTLRANIFSITAADEAENSLAAPPLLRIVVNWLILISLVDLIEVLAHFILYIIH
jgi:hypothetical protein